MPWLLAAAGLLLLPWHFPQDGFALLSPWGEDADATSALAQAVRHGRFWFWPTLVALALAAAGLRWPRLLLPAALLGLLAVAAQGFTVGVQGWSVPWLEALFGPLADRQFGMGLGGGCAMLGFLWLFTGALAARGACRGDRFVAGAVGLLVLLILLFTVWPVARLLLEMAAPREGIGAWASLAERLLDRKLLSLACVVQPVGCGVLWNTLLLAACSATGATLLGLAFALLVSRTGLPGRRALRLLTVLPLITPPFVIGLGLILLFGRAGLFNQAAEALFGWDLGRWIYGFDGVLLAQVFAFTPTAFLVLIGVVEGVSPAMEEAATMLRASRLHSFNSVALPLMLPGIANAWLICCVESLTDFGNPVVLGGSFGVLSTEIFFAVVGAQQEFGRAAVLAAVMLVVALGAFALQRRVVARRSYVSLTGKGDAGLPPGLPVPVRCAAMALALPWAGLTVTVYAMALAGAFVKVWGRDWTPTLEHFRRAFALEWGSGGLILSGGAWHSLGTTLLLAGIAAPITAALGLLAAWLLARQQFRGRTLLEFALMLTFAVPGTVMGVAYILTFNLPPLELTGTAVILLACFVFRNLPVGVRSGLAAMSQLDRSLDEAALTLRASSFHALCTVVLPLLKPAIVTALVYSFVRAVTTVSAVIFLVSAEYEMATVFIINRVINGDYGVAIAYCAVLILLMVAAVGLIQLLVGQRRLGRRAALPVAARA